MFALLGNRRASGAAVFGLTHRGRRTFSLLTRPANGTRQLSFLLALLHSSYAAAQHCRRIAVKGAALHGPGPTEGYYLSRGKRGEMTRRTPNVMSLEEENARLERNAGKAT
jgi:hypothetical protein